MTASRTASRWPRVLLAVLGLDDLVMAVGASPLHGAVAAASGLALIAAAAALPARRGLVAVLLALGTVPFAVLAWWAVAPILVLVVVALVALPVLRRTSGPAPASGGGGRGRR